MIRAGVWGVEIEAEYICPKILGTVVEHIGILPDDATAYLAHKDADPGTTCSLDVELAAEGWAADPWVWVIRFERCERPEGWPE